MPALPDLSNPSQIIADQLGAQPPRGDDPAFQPIRDPLSGVNLKAEAGTVHRDIPIITIATGWDPAGIRSAFATMTAGIFDPISQLIDSVTGDSRVQSGLASRVGGLLGRPVDFAMPSKYRDSPLAQECRDAFVDAWPTMAAESMLSELQTWAIMLGHGHAQNLWDMSGEYAIPHPRVWHPRYTYYNWQYRCLVAVTQDGQVPITGGDGHWILHAPHGEYRGWMRGAVRAIAPWWLSRNYALRDASRWSEANGMPLVKLKHPASADRGMVEMFRASMANRGGETCVDLPQNIDAGTGDTSGFDVAYLEASGKGFDGFFALIAACDREITLALLAQNLTTEVKEGSMAAARVHADVRQALIERDAMGLSDTIYNQLSRPFAAMNFGNADLAPRVIWNVKPYEDDLTAVQTFSTFAQALNTMRLAGVGLEDVTRVATSFGLDLGKLLKLTEGAEIFQYDLAYGIATINEARQRKGLPPRSDGDRTPQAPPPAGATASARFAAMAEKNARLRISLGQASQNGRRQRRA